MGESSSVNLGVTLISNMISSIRAKFLITASCLFLQAVCQDRQYDYDYESSTSSVEFGAPSRPTTTDPSPSPPSQPPFNSTARPQLTSTTTESSTTGELEVVYVYEWINSTSVPTNATARPEITSTTIAGSTTPLLVPFFAGEKKRRRKTCSKLPKARSIKIYECDTWAMRCEYRPSKETEYNLHCKVVPSSSERNRISSEFF